MQVIAVAANSSLWLKAGKSSTGQSFAELVFSMLFPNPFNACGGCSDWGCEELEGLGLATHSCSWIFSHCFVLEGLMIPNTVR